MPIFLATIVSDGATVVNNYNAAVLYAEDTTSARQALKDAYPEGGTEDLWNKATFYELSQSNLTNPIFLNSPVPVTPGDQGGTES